MLFVWPCGATEERVRRNTTNRCDRVATKSRNVCFSWHFSQSKRAVWRCLKTTLPTLIIIIFPVFFENSNEIERNGKVKCNMVVLSVEHVASAGVSLEMKRILIFRKSIFFWFSTRRFHLISSSCYFRLRTAARCSQRLNFITNRCIAHRRSARSSRSTRLPHSRILFIIENCAMQVSREYVIIMYWSD